MRTRRKFLGEASCSAVGGVAALSSLLNLRMMGSLAASAAEPEPDDYKALVCVFLAGGNDSFNMLTPIEGEAFLNYQASRGLLALGANDFTALTDSELNGPKLGLQSVMTELHSLYEAGNCAFVANVGTLVDSQTSLETYQSGEANLPLGLFSHSDQQMHWQSAMPDSRTSLTGWGGRMADILNSYNSLETVSMNVSVSDINLFQTGNQVGVFTVGSSGALEIKNWEDQGFLARRQAATSLLEQTYENVYKRAFATTKASAIEASSFFREAIEGIDPLSVTFTSTNDLSSQLKVVAETIAARQVLGKKRQTFFVKLGGWDLHGGLSEHPGLLAMLSQAVGEFMTAINGMTLSDKVTLFTASDFGRTLASNSKGTDHAWGGNQFVVGGAVSGKKIYGSYPDLALESGLDIGRGRLIPTTSVDEYFADLALWFGTPPGNLHDVFRNLDRFYDLDSEDPPLGLFQ